jgi:hypothetical protein
MFMRGCPPVLEAKRDRINCREIVMRNLLALSAGVRRTVCWNLAPEIPGYENPLSVMDLLFGKFVLLGYDGGELRIRHPSAKRSRCWPSSSPASRPCPALTRRSGRTCSCSRYAAAGGAAAVWRQRDSFHREDEPPVPFDWPWPAAYAEVVDAFGQAQPVEARRADTAAGVPHPAVCERRLSGVPVCGCIES